MRLLATLALSVVLAFPVRAAIVHDEAADGDLSSDPASPTALVFAMGGNTILGTMGNLGSPPDVRDYITFTVPPNAMLMALNLLSYSPSNIGFAAFNAGTTSFIPGIDTDPLFLSGIHVSGSDVGTNLMEAFVTRNVTTFGLPGPFLPPGDYCFLIQQTNAITTTYGLEFVLQAGVPARPSTWGVIKRMYR